MSSQIKSPLDIAIKHDLFHSLNNWVDVEEDQMDFHQPEVLFDLLVWVWQAALRQQRSCDQDWVLNAVYLVQANLPSCWMLGEE